MDWCRLWKHRWQTALHLSRLDWWILWQAWVLLWAVDLGLRLLPFGRVRGLLASRAEAGPTPFSPDTTSMMQRLRWLVEVAGQVHLYPMRCLQQALVLQWLLGRRGIRTELKIGVRKEEEQLYAHAWLEHLGHCNGERTGLADGFATLSAATPRR